MGFHSGLDVHWDGSPSLDGDFFREHGYTATPVILQCYVTTHCELSCDFCLADREGHVKSDMPTGLFDDLCRQASEARVPETLLTGGEPLAHRDFDQIVASLRRWKLPWSLDTAARPGAKWEKAIRSHPPDYVAVSVDGPEDVHNRVRNDAAAFAGAMAAIEFYRRLGATVCVGTTITTENISRLDDLYELVRRHEADRWGIHLLLPEGKAAARRDLFPSKNAMRDLLKYIALKRREFPVTLCDEMGYAGEWETLVRDGSFFCAAGRAMCAVIPDGSVMPCSTLNPKYSEGNVNETPLMEIWKNGFSILRNPQFPRKCRHCDDRAVCGAGCWLQRNHGAQCFKSLWRVPKSIKTAACVSVSLGLGMQGCGGENKKSNSTILKLQNLPKAYVGKAGVIYRGPFEASVKPCLNHLKKTQNSDGSWGQNRTVAMTGLSVLCFIGSGENPTSALFGRSLLKGVKRLVLDQEKDGLYSDDRWEHAIAAWAIGETYFFTKMPRFRESLRKALPVIINERNANGGWSLNPDAADDEEDFLFSVWQIQALMAARNSKIEVPELDETLRGASEYVKKKMTEFAERLDADAVASHPDVLWAGARCCQWLDVPLSSKMKAALRKTLHDRNQQDETGLTTNGLSLSPGSFFKTQVEYQNRKQSPWLSRNFPNVVLSQTEEGDWKAFPFSNRETPKEAESKDRRLYATTTNCLTLLAPYRYLSTALPMNDSRLHRD